MVQHQGLRTKRGGHFRQCGPQHYLRPGLANVNAAVAKNFALPRLGESSRIQFRAEFFNVLNRVNLASKRSESLTSGTYGRIVSAFDPRILQFGLKWQF